MSKTMSKTMSKQLKLIKEMVIATINDNTSLAEQLYSEIIQAKMQKLMESTETLKESQFSGPAKIEQLAKKAAKTAGVVPLDITFDNNILMFTFLKNKVPTSNQCKLIQQSLLSSIDQAWEFSALKKDDDYKSWVDDENKQVGYSMISFLKESIKEVHDTYVSESIDSNLLLLNEWVHNKDFEKLWTKHVPKDGDAKTRFGEAIRAIGRLEYDYFNNGFGNAYTKKYNYNSYGDDDDEEYETPNPFYEELGKSLQTYIKSNAGAPDVFEAAVFITPGTSGARAWAGRRREESKFTSSIKILKDWCVELSKTMTEE